MARRKKDEAIWIIGILGVLTFFLLVLIAILTPFVMLAGFLYNFTKANIFRKYLKGNQSDFWLTMDEKAFFKNKTLELYQTNTIIENANRIGDLEGVSRNQDGTFSARSNLGKELKKTISQNEPKQLVLNEEVNRLQVLPYTRWNIFNSYIKNAAAFGTSFFIWLFTLVYYSWSIGKQSISDVYVAYLAVATNIFRAKDSQIDLPSN